MHCVGSGAAIVYFSVRWASVHHAPCDMQAYEERRRARDAARDAEEAAQEAEMAAAEAARTARCDPIAGIPKWWDPVGTVGYRFRGTGSILQLVHRHISWPKVHARPGVL